MEMVIASGKTSIMQLAALIKRCSVFVTNDTGAMHLAAILKVPLIAIFAGGHIRRFDPRNISENARVIRANLDCSPVTMRIAGDWSVCV